MNKKSGIDPAYWGPHIWRTIHFVAFGYPATPSEQDKKNYKNFYYSLPNILPCTECCEHFSQVMNDPNT